ncbi:MAG: DUF2723 domain-containing protein [Candidatus Zixiibacteriota bacterium]|nr:MAG: DUF2723 domain-containing protein [candidate division Zixibacteria bacterium]
MYNLKKEPFDRTNALLAVVVLLISFVVYALTVQRTFSFWDCGEFIACAYIMGIPHPPGTPLFVILGRIFSLVPFVEDISYRINYISVVSSAFTAMFSYLLTVRIIKYFFDKGDANQFNRFIAYIGGLTGAFFVAFGQTNWANSVEAEVYGMALAMSVMIVWLTMKYFESRGTISGTKIMILIIYMALLGVGIHMTVFMVVPTCAIFFILKRDATPRDWLIVCAFIIVELALIIVFSNGRGGSTMFYMFTAVAGLSLLILLRNKINWAVLIGIGSASSIMLAFSKYMIVTPVALVALILLGILSNKYKWNFQWKTGLALVVVAFLGMSVHAYVPIRSAHNPRIDENNPSRDWRTFVNFLDRKQYGQISMFERMFERRGLWSNQFGRHPHMGFWSFFEEQYSSGSWQFILPFFALGIIGLLTAIKKRIEIGMPFFTLFLICSVGLVLYMNFADGTQYNFETGDAYLEVRNRDYFFTPAFVFFGIAMGMGVAGVMQFLRDRAGASGTSTLKATVLASSVLVLLPLVSLAHNYHANDRSKNTLPYDYAADMLDTCEPNAILFTSGDNDTFPLWCIQEVYDYRKDIVVVNLSLLNTDWYIDQMKNRYGVPISLDQEQILWYPWEARPGLWASRPKKPFIDRPRNRRVYLTPTQHEGRLVKVQDMMTDEIVLENKFRRPIYFSMPPYEQSPLRLRDRTSSVGLLFRLDRDPDTSRIDITRGLGLYMNKYRLSGMANSDISRDESATGVYMGYGMMAVRLFEGLVSQNRVDEALELGDSIVQKYPEYWQMRVVMAEQYDKRGDTTKALETFQSLHDSLAAFLAANEGNIYYMQDLGLTKAELGRRTGDQAMIDEGVRLLYRAFWLHPNSPYGFRKLVTVLGRLGRYQEIGEVVQEFATYKRNLQDPYLQTLLGAAGR